jgi:uncharacterized protein
MFDKCAGYAVPVIIWALVYSGLSIAGPYDDGVAAFKHQDYANAMQLWRPIAEGGDARAQARMAEMYLSGMGVVRDLEQALFWSTKATDQGDARAEYLLASIYRDGLGVSKDPFKAIDLFRRAAVQDFGWAQYNLGLMYFEGEGISYDYREAYYWLGVAANGHNKDKDGAEVQSIARFVLDAVAVKLSKEQISEVQQQISAWKPTR